MAAGKRRDPIEVRGTLVADGPPGKKWFSNVDQKAEDEIKTALSHKHPGASIVAFALMLIRWFMEPASHGGIRVANADLTQRHYGSETKRKGYYIRTMLTILIKMGWITSEGRGTSRIIRPAGLFRKILDRLLGRVESYQQARRRRKKDDARAAQRQARLAAIAEARKLGRASRANERPKKKPPPG